MFKVEPCELEEGDEVSRNGLERLLVSRLSSCSALRQLRVLEGWGSRG